MWWAKGNAVLYVTLATCLDRVVAAARHVRSLTELSRQVSSLATGGLARDPIRAACPTSMDLPSRVSIEPLRWNAMQGGVNWDLNLGILKEESDTSKKRKTNHLHISPSRKLTGRWTIRV